MAKTKEEIEAERINAMLDQFLGRQLIDMAPIVQLLKDQEEIFKK